MLGLLVLSLFALANASIFDNRWGTSFYDPRILGSQFGHNGIRRWSPFLSTRDRFYGATGAYGLTDIHYGYGFPNTFLTTDPEIETVKAKLAQQAPIDTVDFHIVRQKIEYLPEFHVDEIERLIKQKLSHGVPVQKYEAAILKECVKVKVVRGIPLDLTESIILKEVVKAKLLSGIPVDQLEAKICTRDIKNQIVKGEPCDQLDLKILIDFVKHKILTNKKITNLESEVVVEALKQKLVRGIPLDVVEGDVLVECMKKKASRGSPLSHSEEELLIRVCKNKLTTGQLPQDKHEFDLCHEVVKNKLQRGEQPVDEIELQLLNIVPYRKQLVMLSKNLLKSQYGQLAAHDFGYTTGLPWNRCPTTGFYDVIGTGRVPNWRTTPWNTIPTIPNVYGYNPRFF